MTEKIYKYLQILMHRGLSEKEYNQYVDIFENGSEKQKQKLWIQIKKAVETRK